MSETASRPPAAAPLPPRPRTAPTVGRTVLYTLTAGPSRGRVRPATVVEVLDPGNPDTRLQLAVLTDIFTDGLGTNAGRLAFGAEPLSPVAGAASVPRSDGPAEGCWHWPVIG